MTAAVALLRILLDQGHGLGNIRVGQYDPGAVSCGEEAQIVRNVADEVLRQCALSTPSIVLLPECGIDCVQKHPRSPLGKPKSHLRYKVQWVNKHYKPFDYLISLHCNSSGEANGATGVEVFYSDDAPDIRRRQAEAASAALAAVLELPNRGAKPSWKSQHPRLPILDSTKVPALLFELGFITNPVDAEAIEKRGSAAVIAAIEAIRRVR